MVALQAAHWHGRGMNGRSPQAGGCLLVAGIFLGTGIGVALREPSLGFVIGLAAGLALAILFWLLERRRAG